MTVWPDNPPRVTAVKVLPDFVVELSFDDGTVGPVDMKGWVVGAGGVFEPLSDPAVFAQVRAAHGTIEWPGDVDLCPDVLYHKVTGRPLPTAPAPSAAEANRFLDYVEQVKAHMGSNAGISARRASDLVLDYYTVVSDSYDQSFPVDFCARRVETVAWKADACAKAG